MWNEKRLRDMKNYSMLAKMDGTHMSNEGGPEGV